MPRVHLRWGAKKEKTRGVYPRRPVAFVLSTVVHVVTLAAVALGPSLSDQDETPRSLYAIAIAPHEKKLIWYRFNEKLPAVQPAGKTTSDGVTSGRVRSAEQSIVSQPPNAAPGRQSIWQPAPRIRIQQELQSLNLIALEGMPAAPPPARAQPKMFTPPPERAVIDQAPLIDPAPELGAASGYVERGAPGGIQQGALDALRVKPKARTFIAPTSAGRGSGNSEAVRARASLAAPDLGETSSGTGAHLNLAIVGLVPSGAAAGLMPEGTLEAAFSRAPMPGSPSVGGASGAGLRIPNLAIDGGESSKPAVGAASASQIVYLETVLPAPGTTLSVPLRPSSRTIARALEARFQNRAVYTMVVPVDLPLYGGDWIIWFAESTPAPGDTPQVRAPLPARKIAPLPGSTSFGTGDPQESRVQLAARVCSDGRVENVVVLRGASGLTQRAIDDLSSWHFHPASRNGAPVDVDVVIEIPFRLGARLARH